MDWRPNTLDAAELLPRLNGRLREPEGRPGGLRAWVLLTEERRKVQRRQRRQDLVGVWLVIWTGFVVCGLCAMLAAAVVR